MGRHSAPDDDESSDAAVEQSGAVALRERIATAPRGRHAVPDDERPDDGLLDDGLLDDEAPTGKIAPVAAPLLDDAAPTGKIAPVDAQTSARPARTPSAGVAVKHAAHNSAADLHLVRTQRSVLLLALVAVLVPFVVDVVVLAALGDLTARRFLVWIWAPLVAAGILVGLVLDLGHRRHPAATDPPATDPAARSLS